MHSKLNGKCAAFAAMALVLMMALVLAASCSGAPPAPADATDRDLTGAPYEGDREGESGG